MKKIFPFWKDSSGNVDNNLIFQNDLHFVGFSTLPDCRLPGFIGPIPSAALDKFDYFK
jgi:hypothetical protein